jgi:NOL1/NOP2/fmu family ribosome biogenesis protein
MIKEFALESVRLDVKPEWNITETNSAKQGAYGYRFWPDKIKGEGFFIACLRKTEGDENSEKQFRKSKIDRLNRFEEVIVKPWLNKEVDIQLFKLGDSILALPAGLEQSLQEIMAASLYIRLAGIRIGKIAGKDFVPDHALAASQLVSNEVVAVSLNQEQAIQYLRKEEVPFTGLGLTEGNKKIIPGWALVQYDGVNIGWIKILQNRVNNYYPKEWRILKR